jgi:hypothetical protein
MRKVMTILAVAALSASTAFAGGVEDATGDAPTLVQTPPSSMICTSSMVEAGACASCRCLRGRPLWRRKLKQLKQLKQFKFFIRQHVNSYSIE